MCRVPFVASAKKSAISAKSARKKILPALKISFIDIDRHLTCSNSNKQLRYAYYCMYVVSYELVLTAVRGVIQSSTNTIATSVDSLYNILS